MRPPHPDSLRTGRPPEAGGSERRSGSIEAIGVTPFAHAPGGARFVTPDARYQDLEAAHPRDILSWATSTIDRPAIATSFGSSGLVLLHLLRTIEPNIPVLFLDTGFHFPETLAFKERMQEAWDLKVVELRGEHGSPERQAEAYGPHLHSRDPEKCCRINKVSPLQEALEEFDGWISGIRREQSPLRVRTPILEAQLLPSGNEILKVHPLATWTRADVDDYVATHDIPTHPLLEQGFASIGCAPCTIAAPIDDERAGRWPGFSKTECGIHSFGTGDAGRETEADQ
ncbi:MAG: phosphoadenylyl-sulfate reductase [Actinomycetota bacterium]